MDEYTKELLEGVYNTPFTYDPDGTAIFDADNKLVLNIRGWGHLQKLGAECAMSIQDHLGKSVTEFLNKELKKSC